MRSAYEHPVLLRYGSVVSLTLGSGGSDIDGASGMAGNQSNSDQTGGGNNAGGKGRGK